MTTMTTATTATLLGAQCRQLHLPSVGARWESMEKEAVRGRLSHSAYLAGLLEQELEDRAQRRAQRRIAEARFPAVKRLSDFQFAQAPVVPAALIAQLAEGSYIDRAENVLLVGDSGTGKTMIAIGLGVAPASRGSRSASPPWPHWSTSSWRHTTSAPSPGRWGDGAATTWWSATSWAT